MIVVVEFVFIIGSMNPTVAAVAKRLFKAVRVGLALVLFRLFFRSNTIELIRLQESLISSSSSFVWTIFLDSMNAFADDYY